MLFEFYPWKIEADVEATKRLYLTNDYAKDKRINQKFYGTMSDKQKDFFISLGVDIMKTDAEEKTHSVPDEGEIPGEKIYVRSIDFLFCGRFHTIPEYQRHFYSDGEAFGEELPKTLKIVPMSKEEKIPVFGIDGLPCVFKHPRLRFDTPEFRKWDCGYILGSILTMKDLS